ncbi:MAG: hypothetical protein MK076_02155 [Flavobacteriales bacterium]|nr:hypothetical protein [Flavobacteriales bacterium]
MLVKQNIPGLQNHPDRESLKTYSFEVPEGEWTGKLDALAWGKSSNLLCYFTDLQDNQKYCLSTYSNNEYKPKLSDIKFDYEELGTVYKITTGLTNTGRSRFDNAVK